MVNILHDNTLTFELLQKNYILIIPIAKKKVNILIHNIRITTFYQGILRSKL